MSAPAAPKTDAAPAEAAPVSPPSQTAGRRRRSAKQSSWMSHVKATMRAHRGMKLKQVLKIAGKTYKKAMRGGGAMQPSPYSSTVTSQAGGRHRRGHGKTRRSRRGGNMMGEY